MIGANVEPLTFVILANPAIFQIKRPGIVVQSSCALANQKVKPIMHAETLQNGQDRRATGFGWFEEENICVHFFVLDFVFCQPVQSAQRVIFEQVAKQGVEHLKFQIKKLKNNSPELVFAEV